MRLWDATTGRERAAFAWPTDKVRAVAFTPDGMTAAAAGQNGQIVLWDIDEGLTARPSAPHAEERSPRRDGRAKMDPAQTEAIRTRGTGAAWTAERS